VGRALRRAPPRLRRHGRRARQLPHRHRGVHVGGAVAQLDAGEPVLPRRRRTVPRQPLAVLPGAPGAGPPRDGAQPGHQLPHRRTGAGSRGGSGQQVDAEVDRPGQGCLERGVGSLDGGAPGRCRFGERAGPAPRGGRGHRRRQAVGPQPIARVAGAPCGGLPQEHPREHQEAGDGVEPCGVERHVLLPPGKSCRGRGRDRGQEGSYGRRTPRTPVRDTPEGARDPTVVRALREGRSPPPGAVTCRLPDEKPQVSRPGAGRSPRPPPRHPGVSDRLVG
jgi:hypothetical protein